MKIWAVFVHAVAPFSPSRWIDTQWATQKSASERAFELDRVMRAFDVGYHKTTVVEMSVVDAAIKVEPPEVPTDSDTAS